MKLSLLNDDAKVLSTVMFESNNILDWKDYASNFVNITITYKKLYKRLSCPFWLRIVNPPPSGTVILKEKRIPLPRI